MLAGAHLHSHSQLRPAGTAAQGQCAMSGRISNALTPVQLAKVLRGAQGGPPSAALLGEPDIEKVVGSFEGLLCDVLAATPRPSMGVLRSAALAAWNHMDAGSAHLFASRLTAAVTFCRVKAKQSTSCKKLSLAVARVVTVLKSQPPSFGEKLMKHSARVLRKRASDESGKSTCLPFKRHQQDSDQQPSPQCVQPQQQQHAVTLQQPQTESLKRATPTQSVYALYGLPDPPCEQVFIESSQEPESSQEAAVGTGSASSSGQHAQYFHNGFLCLVRETASGLIMAKMTKGTAGMAMATFAGETSIETECPNILLDFVDVPLAPKKPPVCKRPAAAMRQKPDVSLAAVAEAPASPDGHVDGASSKPGANQAKKPRPPMKFTAKNIHSRAYHAELKAARLQGVPEDQAKGRARAAAKAAVLKAQAEIE